MAECIAQVVAYLGTRGALQHGFLELLEDALKLGRRHRPRNQLFKRCGRESRLQRLSSSCVAFMLLVDKLCLAHKVSDRPLTGFGGNSLKSRLALREQATMHPKGIH